MAPEAPAVLLVIVSSLVTFGMVGVLFWWMVGG